MSDSSQQQVPEFGRFSRDKITLIGADNRLAMSGFPNNRFDSIVTDPPYGLTQNKRGGSGEKSLNLNSPAGRSRITTGGGFMGKAWDSGVPDASCWADMLRVSKPGAHLLAFGGPRTHHRLMCEIEDAGWEIRDCIMWVFGCLSDDTEILVNGQWEHYSKAIEGSLALCYNPDDDSYAWLPIQERVTYDYDDTAYKIESEATDQIVSRNHRCLVEQRDGRFGFQFAEEAARKSEICVPVIQDVQGLLKSLPGTQSLAGSEKSDVLKGVRNRGDTGATKEKADYGTSRKEHRLRSLRNSCLEAECVDSQGENSDLLKEMQRDAAGEGLGKTCTQRQGCVDAGKQCLIPDQDEWCQQSGMERRGDLFQDARKLQGGEVCSLSGIAAVNGPEGWVHNGASAFCRASDRAMSFESGSGSSRRPQPCEQPTEQPRPVRFEQRSQAIRGERYATADLARITPIHYRGVVWCVRVPTGAFVARRNGKVFVTGNSGFPKNHDISKAIDKESGNTRERIRGVRSGVVNSTYAKDAWSQEFKDSVLSSDPITQDAAKWQGWGTALKPAYEPIVLARKPTCGTIAENVLQHGTGGLNIDSCRVPCEGGSPSVQRRLAGAPSNCRPGEYPEVGGKMGHRETPERYEQPRDGEKLGRFPANLIHDGSDEVLDLFPDRDGGRPITNPKARSVDSTYMPYPERSLSGSGRGDSGSAARFFYCAKSSPSERGDFNTHPTVKPISLMQYLIRLINPPGGTILDPFTGSGSTALAAILEGAHFVGCENNQDYFNIAIQRINKKIDESIGSKSQQLLF